jgi:hypothetical protein
MKIWDKVRIKETTNHLLDGWEGNIVGTYTTYPQVTFYIIELDKPETDVPHSEIDRLREKQYYLNGSSIVLISSCLEQVY